MSVEKKSMETRVFPTRVSMILYFLKGCKKYFAMAILFVCLLVLFELVDPKIMSYTVDFVVGQEQSIPRFVREWIEELGGRRFVLEHLWIFSGVVIGIAFLGAVCRYTFQLFNAMGAESLVRRMRDTLYDHIIHLPYSWQDENKTGDIIQRCTSDIDMVKNFLSQQMTNLFRMIVMISLALYFMFRLHLVLTLVAFIFVPLVVLYSFSFHKKIGDSFRKVDTEEGKLSAIAQENLTGVRVVRAFGRERYERDRFETKNEYYTGLWVRMMGIMARFWVSMDLICGIQVLTLLCLGSYFAIRGQLSAGQFVEFMAYNALLTFPVRQLGRVVSELSKAGISVDRIRYIMNSQREQDSEKAVEYPGNGDIVFDHVTFSYGKEEPVLKDISMTIREGETVGILGGTGSGKSTLIQLLDGLYELSGKDGENESGGRITFHGVEIGKIKKSELRSHVGIVLQEPYLFSRTLEENIRIARQEAKHREVERVVETASLAHSIRRFAQGYKTYVGERGVTLSGGQKQRTAIAQMLIRQPDVMIFDDSLSAVDAKTDAKIRKGIRKAAENTTCILISHRITTIMQADRIYVLDKGRIREEGTHRELLEKGGIYRKIYELQGGGGYER